MTTANKVTIGRIILVPFFVVLMLYYFRHPKQELYRYLAIATFLAATISDGIDGYLARHRGQATQLGTFMDPIADKLLMFSGLFLLTFEFEKNPFGQHIPLFLTGIVIGRDVIVVAGSTLLYVVIGNVEVKPHILSKTGAVLQMVCIGWVLLKVNVSWSVMVTLWLAIAAAACVVISGLLYLREGIRQFSEHPAGQPGGSEAEDSGP